MNRKKSKLKIKDILGSIFLVLIITIFISNFLHIEDDTGSKETKIEEDVNGLIKAYMGALKQYCEEKGCNWEDIFKECKIEERYEILKKEYITADMEGNEERRLEIVESMGSTLFRCVSYLNKKTKENKSE